jgi:hypothetical protein
LLSSSSTSNGFSTTSVAPSEIARWPRPCTAVITTTGTGSPQIAAQRVQELPAVHARHHQVEQDHVEPRARPGRSSAAAPSLA